MTIKRLFRFSFAVLLLLPLLAAACQTDSSTSGSIEVQEPWVRAMSGAQPAQQGTEMQGEQMAAGTNTAGYLVILNRTTQPDRLLGVKSDISEHVELHLSEVKNDVMSMHPVEAIEIPAGGQAELKPGSYHIMFIGVKQDLSAGQKVNLTLVFENAGEIRVEAPVKAP